MNFKIIILISLLGIGIISGIVVYKYYYVNTLMLSEITGKTDNPIINLAINLADFDTGLTRHDINYLKENKDYWLNKIQQINKIEDPEIREQASLVLLNEMMEDPVLNKICKGLINIGSNTACNIMEMIL